VTPPWGRASMQVAALPSTPAPCMAASIIKRLLAGADGMTRGCVDFGHTGSGGGVVVWG